MKHLFLVLLSSVFLVALVPQHYGVSAQKKDAQDNSEAIKKVKKYLSDKGIAAQRGHFSTPKNKALNTLFADQSFVSVRFPLFPVAFLPPKGLKSSNVFAVPDQGEITVLTKSSEMTNYFSKQLQKRKIAIDKKSAAMIVQAWLALQQEFIQDGYFQFEILKPDISVNDQGAIKAVGRSLVTKGGNGEIGITMEFRLNGSIKMADAYQIKRGPRPKCQATKLLDADPIVRYMAENELLYMGAAARPYLLDQRSKAGPRLRRAITRVLIQIEESGW